MPETRRGGDATQRETNGDQSYVEPMRLSDAEAYVYEAIATLEYLSRPATPAEIAIISELSDSEIGEILRGLAGQRLIEECPAGDRGPAYQLSSRARIIAEPDEPGA